MGMGVTTWEWEKHNAYCVQHEFKSAAIDTTTVCSKKSDAKIEIILTATNLIRIIYPLSSLNYHFSGANVANFNKIHCTVFEQQLFIKWSLKTEVSNMEKSPYQFVRNTTRYSLCHGLCSKWSPFTQTFACHLCRPYVLCCCRTSCLQTLQLRQSAAEVGPVLNKTSPCQEIPPTTSWHCNPYLLCLITLISIPSSLVKTIAYYAKQTHHKNVTKLCHS